LNDKNYLKKGEMLMKSELKRIDELTPHYKNMILQNLSVQERKVISSICRTVQGGNITAKQVSREARIVQTSHVHIVLGRLVKKGFLVKAGRSTYSVKDKKLVDHLLARSSGRLPN
jgi:hypothetical protein